MHEWRDVPVAHPTHPTLPPPDSVVLDAAAGLKALTTGEALELDERGPRYPCFVQRRQGRIVDLCTEVGSRLRAD
jgi:hypothetical protein